MDLKQMENVVFQWLVTIFPTAHKSFNFSWLLKTVYKQDLLWNWTIRTFLDFT